MHAPPTNLLRDDSVGRWFIEKFHSPTRRECGNTALPVSLIRLMEENCARGAHQAVKSSSKRICEKNIIAVRWVSESRNKRLRKCEWNNIALDEKKIIYNIGEKKLLYKILSKILIINQIFSTFPVYN